MGKYRMYEPYGYEDNSNYISKKDQIERELQQNRINDCKEFASVEYNETLQAFVFKNVKGQERGYAYMADIIPSELIKDAYYDAQTKNLIITFVNGKTITIPLDDLIDVVEAGDGLENVDGKFYINLAEDCERFLTVDENGLKLSGVQDAIDAERDRAISAETEEYNRATQAESDLAAAIRQEASDRAENDNLIRQTVGNDFTINPTETVSFKFNELSEKAQKEIDDRITDVRNEAQLRELGDSNLDGKITQEINSRTSEISDLRSTKANKSDVYTKNEVYTKEECDARYSSGGSGSTDAYTKEESDARFQPKGNYATQQWVEDKGYLTEHQDISNLATKDELISGETDLWESLNSEQAARIQNDDEIYSAITDIVETKQDKGDYVLKETYDAMVQEKDAEISGLNASVYSLKKIVGDIGGAVTYELPGEGKTFNTLMNNNGTVKLTDDVETGRFGPGMSASNHVKLNLNTYDLTISGLTTSSAQAAIMARGTQEITIYGKGTVDSGQGICIEGNGANSIINLTGSTTIYRNDRSGGELIYCYSGTINIINGTFRNDGEDKKYLLNCYDANYANGTAKIIVTGGKFYDFNPADNLAEGEHTNFVAEGYHVETSTVIEEDVEHTVYTVKKD